MTSRIQCQYCKYCNEKVSLEGEGLFTLNYHIGYHCIKYEKDVEATSSCEEFKRRIILQT